VSTTTPVEAPRRKTIGVVGAAFLGLGSMVGAGIFALVGQAGAIAGSAVVVAMVAVVLERVWTRARERAAAERVPALR
jgi:amino acid transporter